LPQQQLSPPPTLASTNRDAQLAQTLATLAAEKRATVTPAQIIHDLLANFPCRPPSFCNPHQPRPNSPSPKNNAIIPAEDLKPLYDFTVDCKACQSKLATAQADPADERQKNRRPHPRTRRRLCASRVAAASFVASPAPLNGSSSAPPPAPLPPKAAH